MPAKGISNSILLSSGFKILSQSHVKLLADLAISTSENEA